ncbi:hypothetical protein, partial [Limosilactobacillus reuteri]|uniref:hypothetical protein n=1 Tax=Limosilactobacillus reuteri TaxID=1598 RepID=UPI0024B95A7A
PPYTEPYVRWCERSIIELINYLLLDSDKLTANRKAARIESQAVVKIAKPCYNIVRLKKYYTQQLG